MLLTSFFLLYYAAELVQVTLDYVMEDSGVTTFYCSMEGLLVTSVSWTRDNTNIGKNHDGTIQMDTLVDQYHSTYLSELSIHGTNLSSLVDSVLVCDVYSDWVVVDQSTFGWQRKFKVYKGQVIMHSYSYYNFATHYCSTRVCRLTCT